MNPQVQIRLERYLNCKMQSKLAKRMGFAWVSIHFCEPKVNAKEREKMGMKIGNPVGDTSIYKPVRLSLM
jgi:hypothetical protein